MTPVQANQKLVERIVTLEKALQKAISQLERHGHGHKDEPPDESHCAQCAVIRVLHYTLKKKALARYGVHDGAALSEERANSKAVMSESETTLKGRSGLALVIDRVGLLTFGLARQGRAIQQLEAEQAELMEQSERWLKQLREYEGQ